MNSAPRSSTNFTANPADLFDMLMYVGIIIFKLNELKAVINMASSKEYLDFVLEQLSGLDEITYKAMMIVSLSSRYSQQKL